MSFVTLLTALVGFVLLALTIRQVGWSSVVSGIASLGWMFVIVIALGALRAAMRARAWMVCVQAANANAQRRAGESPRLSFIDAFNALLAADAIGNVTPLGLLASEPAKVMMVRSRLSTVTSIATVAIENACYTVSVLFVLLTGTWLFSQRANLPQSLERAAEVVVVSAIAAALGTLWAARNRPAILSRFGPVIAILGGRAHAPADRLREVETKIYDAAHWPLSRLAHIGVWEALFHVFAVAEVWLVLRVVPGGAQTTLVDAFLMESAGRFVTVAFKFIPFRLGVDEAGSGLVAQVVGIPAVTGVTLALVRRLRIFVLNAAGLLILARRR
ncbi:MAG: lysylphosphatidylglycerol synthase domain-containing protein [Vicinamibacterales bacterium]